MSVEVSKLWLIVSRGKALVLEQSSKFVLLRLKNELRYLPSVMLFYVTNFGFYKLIFT